LTVEFTVIGIPCIGLNGGPEFKHNEAFSFQIATDDQAETDRLWNAIVSNGGQESACGWCKDKWGLSWQITPRALIAGNRRSRSGRRQARFRCDDGDEEDRYREDRKRLVAADGQQRPVAIARRLWSSRYLYAVYGLLLKIDTLESVRLPKRQSKKSLQAVYPVGHRERRTMNCTKIFLLTGALLELAIMSSGIATAQSTTTEAAQGGLAGEQIAERGR
jgi:hypothetical protein